MLKNFLSKLFDLPSVVSIDEKKYLALDACRESITGDKNIKGKRVCVDFVLQGTDKVIFIEADEHAHLPYIALCELTRMQQGSWGIKDGDNLEAFWIRFNPHLLGGEEEKPFCLKERVLVLFQTIINMMKKEVIIDGPKGPFVTYLFYGLDNKNINELCGKEESISCIGQINSIDEIDISQEVENYEINLTGLLTEKKINDAIERNLERKAYGSTPQCDALSLQNASKKRKKSITQCSAPGKNMCVVDGRAVVLCDLHFTVYVNKLQIQLHPIAKDDNDGAAVAVGGDAQSLSA